MTDDESAKEPPRSENLPPARVATAKSMGAVGSKAAPGDLFGKSASSGVVAMAYNYQAMYDYAVRCWDNCNGDYRGFGNDCANFISQIMRVGGWADVPGFYQMLTTDVLEVNWDHPGEPGVPADEPDNTADHAMIVTGTLGPAGAAEEIYLTYHMTDRLNVPFWGWLLPQTEARDVWYAHRT